MVACRIRSVGVNQSPSPEGTTVNSRGRQPTDPTNEVSNESPEGAAQESPRVSPLRGFRSTPKSFSVGLRPRLLTAVASRLTAKASEQTVLWNKIGNHASIP